MIAKMASRKTPKVAALVSRYSFRRAKQLSHTQSSTDDTDLELPSISASPKKSCSNTQNGSGRGRKRKSVEIKFEQEAEASHYIRTEDSIEKSFKVAKPTVKMEENKVHYEVGGTVNGWFPPNWEEALNNIRKMRKEVEAPVDTMGCDQCHDTSTTPVIQRYQILISLMLSSQTKDQVTHAAMGRLRDYGLTPENIIKTDTKVLENLIKPVGFYKRKSEYIKKASQLLLDEYGGDIPDTIEKLCKLPGVGPKMAHICMNCAWNVVTGIGVDVHVHRISQRIGWLPPEVMKKKKKLTPEDTREGLESWLPKSLWSEVNHLLVGFGQTICKPVGPSCNSCLNNSFCPSAKLKW